MMSDFISMVRQKLNPQAHISGIVITRWENSKLSRGIEERLRVWEGDVVYRSKIRKNVRLAEAPLQNRNILDYASGSNGAKDYTSLAEEFLERMNEEKEVAV
jgi:chromosome partitioning protein